MGLTSKKFNKLDLQLQLEKLVIGLEEPLLVKDIGRLTAKVDSGNGGYNVIHGENIITQGDTILFKTIDDDGNIKNVSKKVVDYLDVNIGGGHIQSRPVIELDVQFADKTYKKIKFSVTDRSDNIHKILISKDFIENTIDALIDVGSKNISDQNIKVDMTVNEDVKEEKEYNDFKKYQEYQSTQKSNKQKEEEAKYKGITGKFRKFGDTMKKVGDWYDNNLEYLKSHGGNHKKKVVVDERVEIWKTPAELFAAYPEFYKKDIANIRKQLISTNSIIDEFKKGDTSNTIISADGKKIDAASTLPISLFSYILKKGDAGPKGQMGVVINGQEQRRKLWYQYNGDAKKAMKDAEKEAAKEEKEIENQKAKSSETKEQIKKAPSSEEENIESQNDIKNENPAEKTELINASFEKLFNGSEEILFEGAVDKSYDATFDSSETGNVTYEYKYKKGELSGKEKLDKSSGTNNIDAMQSEADKIRSLKGFIVYYVPFYKGKDSKTNIAEFDKIITSGRFDPRFSGYINAGNGSDASSCASVVSDIKKYISTNDALLEKHPGLFVLCWSQELKKDAPRFLKILPNETFIRRKSNEEMTSERNREIEQILIEKLNIPVVDEDTDFDEINQQLLNALKEYNGEIIQDEENRLQRQRDIVSSLSNKLGIPLLDNDTINDYAAEAKNVIDEIENEKLKSEADEKTKNIDIIDKLSKKLGLLDVSDKENIEYYAVSITNLLNDTPSKEETLTLSDDQIKEAIIKKLDIPSYDDVDYQVLKLTNLLDELDKNEKQKEESKKKTEEISKVLTDKLNLIDISNDETQYEVMKSVEKLLGTYTAHISKENMPFIKKLRKKFNLINAPEKGAYKPKYVNDAYEAISDYLGFKLDPKLLPNKEKTTKEDTSSEKVSIKKSPDTSISSKSTIKKSSPSSNKVTSSTKKTSTVRK